jgi:lipid A disaccharide synthetase
LYSQTKELKHLLRDESFLVNRKYFASDLEKAVSQARSDFRQRNQIPQEGTVVFFAPGNEIKEAEFSLDNVRRGIREFLLKYSSPTSLSPKAPGLENYTTVISVQRGSEAEQYIRQFISEKEWLGKVVIVSNEDNEHFNAMAASDMGIIYDGQMIASAAVCHLPTMCLVKMRMHHQWFSDLYNRWWTPLNIIADNNLYPELIGGEAWFGKIADTLGEWYIKPETRYDMVRKMEYFLKDSLSYKPVDRTEVQTRDLILADGQAYDEFKDPFKQIARHLWADIQSYELRGGKNVPDLSQLGVEVPKMF